MARRAAIESRAEISLTAVTEAVEAVMRASNRGALADEAMAGRIGALIRPLLAQALTGRITSGAELVGQAAFRTILSQHLGGSSAQLEEEARRAAREYLRRNANRTGPEFAALVAQYLRGGGGNGRGAVLSTPTDAEGASETGARFDAISGTDAAFLSEMRSHAARCGLHWAAGRHDILRLGPAAIEALAAVQFQRELFERSIQNGYSARDVVGLARYAREMHPGDRERATQAAHRMGQAMNEAAEIRDPVARENFRRLWQDFAQARPEGRASARAALIEGYVRHGRGNPQDGELVRQGHEALEATAEEIARAEAAVGRAGTETAEDRAAREAREARERAEAAERAAREAERARAEERARQEAAERARLAALLGEESPTKGPAIVVQEGPPTKTPAVQEGPASKEATPPVRLTAAPGS